MPRACHRQITIFCLTLCKLNDFFILSNTPYGNKFPYGLVVRIRRSHRRGPGSIPGVGKLIPFLLRDFLLQ